MPELAANAEFTGWVGLVEAQARDPPARWWSAACVPGARRATIAPSAFKLCAPAETAEPTQRRNLLTAVLARLRSQSHRAALDARGQSGQLQMRWNGNAQEADERDQNENDLGNRDSAWVTLQHPGAPEGGIG
jgi:hypothetical protein